ncbi:MAG: hypothetical protein EHM60_09915 [Lysobacterales bacterium]|jgi:hypothetical protein|nr:MAG: hypothetical protein EHM60_09915 [Xanthomonadales bacterium]
MTIKNRALGALAATFALVSLTGAAVAADRPYAEGPVTVVSSIRTLPGMQDTYLKYLATTYKTNMEAAKKAGIILDYSVYEATPRSADDPDLYLTVTYKNMAAMDGLDEKMEPIMQSSFGDDAARSTAAIDREKMRRQVGQETIREVVLK